jgi:hypothetical protein
MSHLCAVTTCDIRVSSSMLMCKGHWFMVPPPVRSAVLKHWRAKDMTAYRAARQQAIDCVDKKLREHAL